MEANFVHQGADWACAVLHVGLGGFEVLVGAMAISVMIQRTFTDNEKATKLAPLIVKLRSLATIQPGYLTGKTFRCLDCPGEFLVISTWNSMDDWNRWLGSEERRALQKRVDDLLGEPTRYRLYEPLVGGIIPRFQTEGR